MSTFYKIIRIIVVTIICYSSNAQVGINTDGSEPDSTAILDVKSAEKGFLPPRMTENQRDSINNPAKGLQIFNTSTNRPNYFNGSMWTHFNGSAAEAISIGDFHAGGVVFWLNNSGGGLICAIIDQNYNGDYTFEWGCFGNEVNGADGISIGTGKQNTNDIVAECSTAGIAAYVCSNLSLNGYYDWFLPSKDELNEIYNNKDLINPTIIANGGTILDYVYWSSTEDDENYAWKLVFPGGNWFSSPKNDDQVGVRAIRAF